MRLFIIGLTVIFSLQINAETLFVKSVKAPIKKSKDVKAEVVEELSQGAELTVKSKDGTWLEVQTPSKNTGWILKLLTSSQIIKAQASLLDKDVDLSKDARRRASQFTSAAAARGLLADNSDRFSTLSEGNEEELKKLEALYVKPSVGLSFLQKSEEE